LPHPFYIPIFALTTEDNRFYLQRGYPRPKNN
jgi:hypothetical protein